MIRILEMCVAAFKFFFFFREMTNAREEHFYSAIKKNKESCNQV